MLLSVSATTIYMLLSINELLEDEELESKLVEVLEEVLELEKEDADDREVEDVLKELSLVKEDKLELVEDSEVLLEEEVRLEDNEL